MHDIKIISPLRTWLAKRSLVELIIIWTALYSLTGFAFSVVYFLNLHRLTNAQNFADAAYFSFTTLATVGYGDITPTSWNRLFASLEAFFGFGLNSTLLGIIVIVLLKRPSPVIFPENLVYDVHDTTFWFRSLNVSKVPIVNPSFTISLTRHLVSSEGRTDYDLVGGYLKLPYPTVPRWDPMILVGTRSTRLASREAGPLAVPTEVPTLKFPEHDLIPSPLHLIRPSGNVGPLPVFTISITGNFADTGQLFFTDKSYSTDNVKCGEYRHIENAKFRNWPLKEIAREFSKRFNVIKSTSEQFCSESCPLHPRCPLDVAAKIRLERDRCSIHRVEHNSPERTS